MSGKAEASIPAHVPPDRVFDFDTFHDPAGIRVHAQREVAEMLRAKAPDIFFTPRNGGHWVVTRVADVVEIFRQPELFSNDPAYIKARQMYPRFAPLEYDPPTHTNLRRIVNPFFTPGAVQRMFEGIRSEARSLIEEIAPRGECEFVAEVAQRYPVNIFLKLADANLKDREYLLDFAHGFLRNPVLAERAKARAGIAQYLSGIIDAREKNPGGDLISMIATSRLPERELTRDEKIGFATFAFFAGLDTVMAMLSHIIHFLARNPDHYAKLVAEPDTIPTRLEELIRTHGVNLTDRGVTQDTEYRGVKFRKDDRIVIMFPIMGLDDHETPEPGAVDFDRTVSRHINFGAGPHRCLGSHLARAEMKIFLEEWTSRFPAFGLAEDVRIRGGSVWVPEALHLRWNP